ncbi:F-box/kelch-repeat protein [Trifolium pratense]|uniref:F-box/kelch-repeat protein n=1 Tax=Trifolium pratense TaxID=57577 RepID=A0A2K3LTB7_TRIPR|nr:F-box/kelch-repeat protein [Trifolium pratense]
MNTELPMSQRRHKSNPSPSVILPDDLVVEILCFLKVKPLMKMKCVCKSWNILISDPKFVKMHLNQSSRNSHSYVVSSKDSKQDDDYSFIPFNVNDLLENSSITFPDDPYYRLIDKDCHQVVGSCNGLVCLLGYSLAEYGHKETCFRLWNPATRTISDKLGYFPEDMNRLKFWKFIFGYDNLTDAYKVVALHPGNSLTTVLNCTVNWLAVGVASMFVIISLDLGTETHAQLLVPSATAMTAFATTTTATASMTATAI